MATELKRSDAMDRIAELLGADASKLLDHKSETISKDDLQLPGPDFVEQVVQRVLGLSEDDELAAVAVLVDHQIVIENSVELRPLGVLAGAQDFQRHMLEAL